MGKKAEIPENVEVILPEAGDRHLSVIGENQIVAVRFVRTEGNWENEC